MHVWRKQKRSTALKSYACSRPSSKRLYLRVNA
jgi:hypothetical protein